MRGYTKEFPNPPICIKGGIRRGMVHKVDIVDVHRNPSWLLEEMWDVLGNIPGVKETSSFCKHTSDKAVCREQVGIHLLTVITILELTSILLKVLGGESGPNRNVRGFVLM